MSVVNEWWESQKALTVAKEKEAILRDRVLAEVLSYNEAELKSGTERTALGGGYSLKVSYKVTMELPKNDALIKAKCAELRERFGDQGHYFAEQVLKTKSSIDKKVYDSMPTEIKDCFNGIVTSKSGKPSIEIEAPKGE